MFLADVELEVDDARAGGGDAELWLPRSVFRLVRLAGQTRVVFIVGGLCSGRTLSTSLGGRLACIHPFVRGWDGQEHTAARGPSWRGRTPIPIARRAARGCSFSLDRKRRWMGRRDDGQAGRRVEGVGNSEVSGSFRLGEGSLFPHRRRWLGNDSHRTAKADADATEEKEKGRQVVGTSIITIQVFTPQRNGVFEVPRRHRPYEKHLLAPPSSRALSDFTARNLLRHPALGARKSPASRPSGRAGRAATCRLTLPCVRRGPCLIRMSQKPAPTRRAPPPDRTLRAEKEKRTAATKSMCASEQETPANPSNAL